MKLSQAPFGTSRDQKAVSLYTLSNDRGMTVEICNIGCSIVSVKVPDRDGNSVDVALGYDTVPEYEANPSAFGAVTGQFAARIRRGQYQWNGKTVQLELNEGKNNIHGGSNGFAYRYWDCIEASGERLRFQLFSPDGDSGFPGDLTVVITYTLTDDNTLVWESEASTLTETICCLTNHSYFNLNGCDSGSTEGQYLTINSDYILEIDEEMLPTGRILPVAGTPFDFTSPKKLGCQCDEDHPQLKIAGGYDHYFILRPFSPISVQAYSEETGIVLTLRTNAPGIQLYAGNFLNGTLKAKGGYYPQKRGGFCPEPISYPDAVNQPNFPSCVVSRNNPQKYRTELSFSVK